MEAIENLRSVRLQTMQDINDLVFLKEQVLTDPLQFVMTLKRKKVYYYILSLFICYYISRFISINLVV